MFRAMFVGIVAAIVFGLLGFLPVIGPVFLTVSIVSISAAGILLVAGLIKLLFFSW